MHDTENQQFLLTSLNTPTEWFTTCFLGSVNRHLTWETLDQREKRKRFSWSYVAERDVPDSQISRIDWKSDIHSGLSMKYTDSSKNKTRSTDIRPWQKRLKRGLRHPTGLSRESWKQQNAHQWISSLRCSRSHFFCYWMIKSVMQSYVKWKKKKQTVRLWLKLLDTESKSSFTNSLQLWKILKKTII